MKEAEMVKLGINPFASGIFISRMGSGRQSKGFLLTPSKQARLEMVIQ